MEIVGKKSKGQVVVLVFLFLVFLVLRFVWMQVAPVLQAHGVPPAIVGLFALVVIAWRILSWIKQLLLKSSPEAISFVSADPKDFPWLQHDDLAQLSANLRTLGFLPLQDFTIDAKGGNWRPGFARLFHNPETHCYAELNQVQTEPSGRMQCSISSRLEDGWSLSTTTRMPLAGSWITRKPKSVWTSHPLMSLEELLHAHLSWRENLIYYLGIQVLHNTSFEEYQREELENHRINREILHRKPMISILIEYKLFPLRPKMEWRGDFGKAAAQVAKTRPPV